MNETLQVKWDRCAASPFSRVTAWAYVGVVLAIGLLRFPLTAMGTDLSDLPGDEVDGRFNNYVLEHGYRFLRGLEPRFWDAPLFYPTTNVTARSDSHIGTLPLYALPRWCGADRETAYQLWWLSAFVLNYVVSYLVLRRLSAGVFAASAGAYLFAFALPLGSHLDHSQLFPRWGVPLAFLFAFRFMKTGRTQDWLGLGLTLVWQLYATVYVGYFLVLTLAGFVVGLMLRRPAEFGPNPFLERSPSVVARRVFVVVLCGVLLWPLIQAHAKIYDPELAAGIRLQIELLLPRARSWVLPPPHSLCWSWLCQLESGLKLDSLVVREHRLFPGLVPALAVMFGLLSWYWKPNSPAASAEDEQRWLLRSATASVMFVVMLTLKLDCDSLYWLVCRLPGAGAVRAVGRIGLVLSFPAAVLAALAATSWLQTLAGRSRTFGTTAAGLGLLGLVVADQSMDGTRFVRISKHLVQERTRCLVETVRRQKPSALAMVVLSQDGGQGLAHPVIGQLEAMAAAQELGIPTLNGYTGHPPKGWWFFYCRGDVDRWASGRISPAQVDGLVVIDPGAERH